MGIDACMVIKYRGEKPTDEQLTRWSWDLCRAVGAHKFFIQDGMPIEQQVAASKHWHERFKAHKDYPAYANGDRSVHDGILKDLSPHPEPLRRAIDLTCRRYPEEGLEPGKVYTQDGDDVLAAEGEWLLEVSLWTRYYGVGYERGDLMTICATAEWIEQNIVPCEVWYGGDSSGVCITPFGPDERESLKEHFYSLNGRDYFKHFGRDANIPQPKPCGLCIPNEPRFNQYGFGQNYAAVSCGGCGKNFETRDNGVTWVEKK